MATSTSMKTVTDDEDNQIFVNDDKVESSTPTNQAELRCKIEKLTNELEMSQFYHEFRKELQRKPISECIRRVLGSESKMQMIIYGIGSISDESEGNKNAPKLQLSLAILMKKDFTWIGEVQVFDPVLSEIEIQVLKSFGCTVLSINEEGKRQALKPTMFFMPHCELDLYNNLLEANWKPDLLSNVIIFGNSLDRYIKQHELFSKHFSSNYMKRKLNIWEMMGHVLAAQTFTDEFKMTTISYEPCGLYCHSFFGLNWHFFGSLTTRKMQMMRKKTMEEHGVNL
ncbi:hypothetical protein K1719_043854 [Acacia pycnantha]|nr:hypothetical protein K1719_043854 [Acacia pycnantha]